MSAVLYKRSFLSNLDDADLAELLLAELSLHGVQVVLLLVGNEFA